MKIGSDFDGVINRYPAFFARLSKLNHLTVISGRLKTDYYEIANYLAEHKIKSKKIRTVDKDDPRFFDDLKVDFVKVIGKEKVKFLKEEKIDIYFEDDLRLINEIKKHLPKLKCFLVI